MRRRTAALAAGTAVVLAAAVVVAVAALPGIADDEAGGGSIPVTTVRTTVYVDPPDLTAAERSGAVTAPPLIGGTGDAVDSAAGALSAAPSTGASGVSTAATSTPPPSTTTTVTTATSTTATSTTATSTTATPSPPTTNARTTLQTSSTSTRSITSTTYPSFSDTITAEASASAGRLRAAVASAVKKASVKGITQSVVVLDRKTGKPIVSVNANRPVPAVSIAKLLFATDELVQAGGGANLDAQAAADLFDMIRRSNDDLADDYYGYHGESDIVQRVAGEYHLTGTKPATDPRYWGGITVTAADIASLLRQTLADPDIGPYLAAPMKAASHTAADGYNQEFGMNAIVGAGSKQGWGCCLGGVVAIHSAGFTANRIVVVLSTAPPDAAGINKPEVSSFENDPGFKASVAAVTATAKAAVHP